MKADKQLQAKERHFLALSGGKDSAALAVYLREKHPELKLEYVFIDTGCELPETYEYLDRIRAFLNIAITRIRPKKDWEHYWSLAKVKRMKKGAFTYLPSPKNRWCTEVLKLVPYEKWITMNFAHSIVHTYIGLRADEKQGRVGFIPNKPNIIPHYPFVEDGLVFEHIKHLLLSSGLNFPKYYEWRKRSGCYFCFYQSKKEWIGLYEHHEDLFRKAQGFETLDDKTGQKFTWCDGMSLEELLEKKQEILNHDEDYEYGERNKNKKLIDTLSSLKVVTNVLLKEG
jgi:hypothetical protein